VLSRDERPVPEVDEPTLRAEDVRRGDHQFGFDWLELEVLGGKGRQLGAVGCGVAEHGLEGVLHRAVEVRPLQQRAGFRLAEFLQQPLEVPERQPAVAEEVGVNSRVGADRRRQESTVDSAGACAAHQIDH
jgi:hypothetical protein